MSELLDFGKHGPYIIAAYSATVVVLGALILYRRAKLAKAREADKRQNSTEEN